MSPCRGRHRSEVRGRGLRRSGWGRSALGGLVRALAPIGVGGRAMSPHVRGRFAWVGGARGPRLPAHPGGPEAGPGLMGAASRPVAASTREYKAAWQRERRGILDCSYCRNRFRDLRAFDRHLVVEIAGALPICDPTARALVAVRGVFRIRRCRGCGREMESLFKRHRLCESCWSIRRRRELQRICEHCGGLYVAARGRAGGRFRFCSTKCAMEQWHLLRSKWGSHPRVCLQCGVALSGRRDQLFHSAKCRRHWHAAATRGPERTWRRWTEAEDALCEQFGSGLTGPEIALTIGRSLAAVQTRARKLRRRHS